MVYVYIDIGTDRDNYYNTLYRPLSANLRYYFRIQFQLRRYETIINHDNNNNNIIINKN